MSVTARLQELTRSWQPDDPSWQGLRRELLDRINWWNRVFLAAHIPDHHVPALLVDLIRSAPVWLGPCVARVLAVHHAQATIAGPAGGEVYVFCPEKLLDQIVSHLIENVHKHRVPGADPRLHIEYVRPDEGSVQLIMRNSGTRSCTPPGRGLSALGDKLRPFGGKLAGEVIADGEWSFKAVLTLPQWHGG